MSEPEWMKKYNEFGVRKLDEHAKQEPNTLNGSDAEKVINPDGTASCTRMQKGGSFAKARCSLRELFDAHGLTQENRNLAFSGSVVSEDGTRVRRFDIIKERQSLLSAGDESIASPYRKMLFVGVPGGAVRDKMLYDRVSKHIIDAVMTSDYRKMLDVGVPTRAIQDKMLRDGIPKGVVDAMMARSNKPDTRHGDLAKKEPIVAGSDSSKDVVQMEECDENEALHTDERKAKNTSFVNARRSLGAFLVSQHTHYQDPEKIFCGIVRRKDRTPARKRKRGQKKLTTPPPSVLSPTDEVLASPYRKMLVVGVPFGGVLGKMRYDRVEKHIIDAVMTRNSQAYIRRNRRKVRVVKRRVNRHQQRQRLPTLCKGPTTNMKPKEIAAPYVRLLKMGVMPYSAVKQKMVLDGVSRNIMYMVEAAAKASNGDSTRSTRNQIGAFAIRSHRTTCGGRGALLRQIVAVRGRSPSPELQAAPNSAVDNTPSKRAVVGNGFSEDALIQKMQEIEERQKRCLALLDKVRW